MARELKGKDLYITVRVRPEIRAEIIRLSKSLEVTEADVARAALRTGFQIIRADGIRPAEPRPAA
jgi:hypothetical protein